GARQGLDVRDGPEARGRATGFHLARTLVDQRIPAPGADPFLGRGPARVQRMARSIDVDHERRVVRWDRLALARLTIALGPYRALGDRARRQQVIDPHSEVLVEVPGAVIPPGVTAG